MSSSSQNVKSIPSYQKPTWPPTKQESTKTATWSPITTTTTSMKLNTDNNLNGNNKKGTDFTGLLTPNTTTGKASSGPSANNNSPSITSNNKTYSSSQATTTPNGAKHSPSNSFSGTPSSTTTSLSKQANHSPSSSISGTPLSTSTMNKSPAISNKGPIIVKPAGNVAARWETVRNNNNDGNKTSSPTITKKSPQISTPNRNIGDVVAPSDSFLLSSETSKTIGSSSPIKPSSDRKAIPVVISANNKTSASPPSSTQFVAKPLLVSEGSVKDMKRSSTTVVNFVSKDKISQIESENNTDTSFKAGGSNNQREEQQEEVVQSTTTALSDDGETVMSSSTEKKGSATNKRTSLFSRMIFGSPTTPPGKELATDFSINNNNNNNTDDNNENKKSANVDDLNNNSSRTSQVATSLLSEHNLESNSKHVKRPSIVDASVESSHETSLKRPSQEGRRRLSVDGLPSITESNSSPETIHSNNSKNEERKGINLLQTIGIHSIGQATISNNNNSNNVKENTTEKEEDDEKPLFPVAAQRPSFQNPDVGLIGISPAANLRDDDIQVEKKDKKIQEIISTPPPPPILDIPVEINTDNGARSRSKSLLKVKGKKKTTGNISFAEEVTILEISEKEDRNGGMWKDAPPMDVLWNGEEKKFWDRELTPEELAYKLLIQMLRAVLLVNLGTSFNPIVVNFRKRKLVGKQVQTSIDISQFSRGVPDYRSVEQEEKTLRDELMDLNSEAENHLKGKDADNHSAAFEVFYAPSTRRVAKESKEAGLKRIEKLIDDICEDDEFRAAVGLLPLNPLKTPTAKLTQDQVLEDAHKKALIISSQKISYPGTPLSDDELPPPPPDD